MDVLFLKFLDCDFNYMGFFYGNCGFFGVIIYLVSYVIVVFLVIVNMYIVIIFENVNCVYEIEDFCIIKENFDSYYIIWGMFVLDGKFYLFLDCFLEFVDFFEKLFKIFQFNVGELRFLDILVCVGEFIYCFDLFKVLV